MSTSTPEAGTAGVDAPSASDSFVRAVSSVLGGPLGRHAVRPRAPWALLVAVTIATLTWLLAILQKLPCRDTVAGHDADRFRHLCYTDIPLLYRDRGLVAGHIPYLDSGPYPPLEYPVLTGWLVEVERRITVALGAPVGANLSEQAQLDASVLFYDVNTVLLFGCFLVAVWAQVHTVVGRPWDGMMLAAAPAVATAGLINWDLLPLALTAVGFWCWSRRRPGGAGVAFGLGMAAKLYPVFLLGPLLLLCLRGDRTREFGRLALGFVVSWLAVNLPVLVLAPSAWLEFWRFNADRGADLGSIWYVLSLAGYPIGDLNTVSTTLFVLACLGIGALILLAPRRPRFGAVSYLVVVAFLMVNKVYSPQYVLWLLPLMILARPRWRDWLIFTAGELVYFVAIWWHLGGELSPGSGAADRTYWLAVLLRIATEGWVAALVVRDILRPEHDPVRNRPGVFVDDPGGGVLDGAPDAGWRLGAGAGARR